MNFLWQERGAIALKIANSCKIGIGFSIKVLIENNMKRALIISGFNWGKAFYIP